MLPNHWLTVHVCICIADAASECIMTVLSVVYMYAASRYRFTEYIQKNRCIVVCITRGICSQELSQKHIAGHRLNNSRLIRTFITADESTPTFLRMFTAVAL